MTFFKSAEDDDSLFIKLASGENSLKSERIILVKGFALLFEVLFFLKSVLLQ